MKSLRSTAILASCLILAACADPVLKSDPAALHGDYSGKDFSGSVAFVLAPGDIPGIPESKGKRARWSPVEIEQTLYIDADCQSQLYLQLPGVMQALVKEGGWSALATAVGEGLFASVFPGAAVATYMRGGAGIGAATGANTGRYRQDSSVKGALGYCDVLNLWETKYRYPGHLTGINAVPWYGNGQTTLPKAKDSRDAPTLPPIRGYLPPLPGQ